MQCYGSCQWRHNATYAAVHWTLRNPPPKPVHCHLAEGGQDTSACQISGHSHVFSSKCLETSPDGRTCPKTVMAGRMDWRTHAQVERGYFRLWTDGRTDGQTDGQSENIMPPAPKGGGIKSVTETDRQWDGRTEGRTERGVLRAAWLQLKRPL